MLDKQHGQQNQGHALFPGGPPLRFCRDADHVLTLVKVEDGRSVGKTFAQRDGAYTEVSGHDAGTLFNWAQIPIDCVSALFGVLQRAVAAGNCMAVVAPVRIEKRDWTKIRRKRKEDNEKQPGLVDGPSAILMFDLDNAAIPDGHGYHDTAAVLRQRDAPFAGRA